MYTKRKRRQNQQHEGLSAGERLKRHKLTSDLVGDGDSPWGWVGTSVNDASGITEEHLLATCGFSCRSHHLFCANKYRKRTAKIAHPPDAVVSGKEPANDIVIVSDDETPPCSKRHCSKNPNCLNYLAQDRWEDAESALKAFLSATNLGPDPCLQTRKPGLPVGLRNLGATCYANAYIQVWFQDLCFRNGVYQCLPVDESDQVFDDSPIFQLQTTFAALQESRMKVFNPEKLVGSLQLRTNEQQDAQEFSKLFITHLDDEFKKQPHPALKHLVSNQFEGTQTYATTCLRCGARSENDSDFLEIEVNLEDNASLESCIEVLLQPETLSGDNKYRCSRCQSLEDATRQLILQKLPPVLHFSLLRFVFDVMTLERKKRKHNVSFPVVLDMNRFLRGQVSANEENIYELKGVLIHKGSSAYHGHYEAMVFDVTHDSWFTFNDEVVSKMRPPGSEPSTNDKGKTRPKSPKKRRRVEDSSEDEVAEIQPPLSAGRTSSRDAYMLVYMRREAVPGGPVMVQRPPQRALDVVLQMNQSHADACATFATRREALRNEFLELRSKIQDIYRSWHVSSCDQPSLVVSQQALNTFLYRPFDKRFGDSIDHVDETGLLNKSQRSLNDMKGQDDEKSMAPLASSMEGEITVKEIQCPHGRLDPGRAADMKRIDRATYDTLILASGASFCPTLEPTDICRKCVEGTFLEKLYQYEHPKVVAQFDAVVNDADSVGYWISRHWVKDWRQPKPKMHVPSQCDPAPDSQFFRDHVICEHGGLALNISARSRISQKAFVVLKTLFPSWVTLSDAVGPCAVCDALAENSREDKRELRKKSEEEKARLKHMQENALNGNTALLENVPCALVPASFVREWKLWILRPGHHPRPAKLDNSPFLCDHGLLALDLNGGDLDRSVCLVRLPDWDTLMELYDASPLITVENQHIANDGIFSSKFIHEPPLCEECRIKRKTDYDLTEITIRVLGGDDSDPTPESYTKNPGPVMIDSRQTSILTYRSRNAGPQRQSKRIRTVKRRVRRIGISKQMSVKDIKLLLQEELNIPTICQRLFYQGHELADSSASVEALSILANDVLDLREEQENEELLETDTEGPQPRREADGGGFGGTLLARGWTSESLQDDTMSDRTRTATSSPAPMDTTKACPMCTFENEPSATACEICEAPL
ncbi:cysteine proteinase [Russula earlei]|uniref:Cysteine proteinase n=1 Tax=Russula earlei TaxID=71964 RepID=A0ACC0U9B3_9AGAM|nr:cysteine proteinase [Russula earlei]